MHRPLALLAILVTLCLGFALPAAAENCYADWSEAGPIVREQGLVPAKDLQDLAKAKVEGKLIKITLCEDQGNYLYRLVFDKNNGELVDMTVDARTPFQP